jgi:D-tagatose-bisphosphate aldolase class II non-catalytic subunit
MTDPLRDIITRNRGGETVAIASICSAHPDVLHAAMLLSEECDQPLLIEATSNQVNQDGGYTGMTPANFIGFVHDLAAQTQTDPARILFGGDHLGPQAWKAQSSEEAMENARAMVAQYVEAGFTKVHLDCSEGCAGEPTQLDDQLVATRAADLARVCERHAPDPSAISYVIGTEVPVPGGARPHDDHGVKPTTPRDAIATIDAHLDVFGALPDLAGAKDRIVGLVVQPGVEFAALSVDHLPAGQNPDLRAVLDNYPHLAFEAHSTDYQHAGAYPRLADMGFAIQKVGPALTFAYRQAVYGLDVLATILGASGAGLRDALEAEMLASPAHWQGHYQGDADQLRLQRHFAYSDRVRYYWGRSMVRQSLHALLDGLADRALPDPLLEQVFARDILDRTERLSPSMPKTQALVLANIQTALVPYYFSAEPPKGQAQ